MANTFGRLSAWYSSQCNGIWEQDSRISIESCDNPGWWVKIDLKGTPLLDQAFASIAKGVDAWGHPNKESWIHCQVKDGKFSGAGDPERLEEILILFLTWAEAR